MDHIAEDEMSPPILETETKTAAFLWKYQPNDCYEFYLKNEDAFFNVEIVKTLILHGEMDAVLRVCAHPENDLLCWWTQCRCECSVSTFEPFP